MTHVLTSGVLLVPWRYGFMRDALAAGAVMAIVAGMAGYFVILRRLVFAGDALAHIGFAGALGAAVAGLDPLVGLFGVTGAAALGMAALGERLRARDVAIGTVLAWMLGLGVWFLSIYTSQGSGDGALAVNILFGTILGIGPAQARIATIIGALGLVALLALARPLLFATIMPDVAQARGLPVRVLGAAFLLLMAITVAEAVQVVGVLLLITLLVTPAAIAQRLVARPYAALVLAGALALGFTWAGLLLAFYIPLPVSFFISALACGAYIAVLLATRGQARRHML